MTKMFITVTTHKGEKIDINTHEIQTMKYLDSVCFDEPKYTEIRFRNKKMLIVEESTETIKKLINGDKNE